MDSVPAEQDSLKASTTMEDRGRDSCSTTESSQGDFQDTRVEVDWQVESDDEAAWSQDTMPRGWFSWKRLFQFMGPGFLMSIAYIDPGNLESDLQAGASTGYSLLWVLLCSTAMGYMMQCLAAKLGVVTGRHLAEHCRTEYPRPARITLWIMTELAIIGSDIQEVIGSAIAIALLSNGRIPLYVGVLITGLDSFLLLFVERLGVRNLEALFAFFISVMAVAFGVMYGVAGVPTLEVLEGLVVPEVRGRQGVQTAVAMVGAVIMPHNIYLHSALVHSRKLNTQHVARKKEAVAYFNIESGLALAVSLVINVCVVAVFARGFYGTGVADIGLQNAGEFLGRTFGKFMAFIWAVGLLSAGQSSTMTGTYTGQFVMSGFLQLRATPWQRIMVTRSVAMVPTIAVALLYQNASGNQLDVFNQWLNVLQSIQLPFALVPVLMMTSSTRIMGTAFVNSRSTIALACAISAMVVAINMSLAWSAAELVLPPPRAPGRAAVALALGCVIVAYLAFIAYLFVGPERASKWQEQLSYQAAHLHCHQPPAAAADNAGEDAEAAAPSAVHPQLSLAATAHDILLLAREKLQQWRARAADRMGLLGHGAAGYVRLDGEDGAGGVPPGDVRVVEGQGAKGAANETGAGSMGEAAAGQAAGVASGGHAAGKSKPGGEVLE